MLETYELTKEICVEKAARQINIIVKLQHKLALYGPSILQLMLS